MDADLPALTAALLDAARRAGADAADAMAVAGTSTAIDVRFGRLEQAERSENLELGLRVLLGRRQACVAASDAAPATLAAMAERAVAMAREAPEDATVGLADPDALARDTDPSALELDDPAAEPDAAALLADARAAEEAARGVAGITQIDQASASWSRKAIWLAATNGFEGGYARTARSVSCVAITGTGTAMERDWASESRVWQADLPAPAMVGLRAAERAVARAGARKPPTGPVPVLFDERVAASLIGHLLSAVNGSAVARGASWARDLLGQRVLPAGIDVIEDPHRPRIGGSRPFDAEGLPTARRAIVADGVLMGWVLDLGTGRRLGLASTGNAMRSPSAPPSPGTTNIDLTQGSRSRDDLIRDMGRGLVVTSLLGASINATTGDYSRGAAGFWVEGGAIAHPVNECTIAGNLRDMLPRIVPANDAQPHLSVRVPSLLVEGLTVSGA
jgi:PmbA protein